MFKFLSKILLILHKYRYLSITKRILGLNLDFCFDFFHRKITTFCLARIFSFGRKFFLAIICTSLCFFQLLLFFIFFTDGFIRFEPLHILPVFNLKLPYVQSCMLWGWTDGQETCGVKYREGHLKTEITISYRDIVLCTMQQGGFCELLRSMIHPRI